MLRDYLNRRRFYSRKASKISTSTKTGLAVTVPSGSIISERRRVGTTMPLNV